MSELITAKAINSTLGTSNFRSLDTLLGEDIQVLSQKLDRVNTNLESRTWWYVLPPLEIVRRDWSASYLIWRRSVNDIGAVYECRAIYPGWMYLKIHNIRATASSFNLYVAINGSERTYPVAGGVRSGTDYTFEPFYTTLELCQHDTITVALDTQVNNAVIELHADFSPRPLNVIEEV